MNSVEITRLFDATPQRVWDAFTNPAALAEWFWPTRLNPSVTTDPRPGGTFRITGTGMGVSGVYREVTPPARLVFTWLWDGGPEESLVTIELSAVNGKCQLHLTHTQTTNADPYAEGWHDCLNRLTDWL